MSGRRTALVTGASRGIGLAVARELLARDFTVALVARTASAARAHAAPHDDRAIAIDCDLADAAAVDRMTATVVERLGGAPDVIVNNAGSFAIAPLHETSPADFARALELNLVGPFRVIRAFLPAMRARGSGHVVTIGSIADHVAFAGNGAYAASKYGLRGLHEVLRAELARTGLRATLISPGPVDTPLWDEIDPDNRPGFSPRSEMLRPEAVAAAVAYVVSQPDGVNVDELRLSRA